MTKRKKQRRKAKTRNKKTKQMKTTTNQKMSRQHVPVTNPLDPADPVTRVGLPPELVQTALAAEELIRPFAVTANALAKAIAARPLELSALLARAAARRETEAAQKTLRSEPAEGRSPDPQA